ncbi:fimbrial protein [Salmonella enterica]|nr:fimbrial protein [Salmonella enterica]ECO1045205.1 fimbrial protein [Salmonella enterica subsp. enterica serovar Newport]EDR8676190.1 fimbrial protein [Salmonella enterica]
MANGAIPRQSLRGPRWFTGYVCQMWFRLKQRNRNRQRSDRMKKHYQWGMCLLAGLLGWEGCVRADIPITITATIIEPVCSVTGTDGDSLVKVDFGNVQLQDINTTQAQQPLRMQVSCDGAAPDGKVLKMLVNPAAGGVMTVGGVEVLGTSMTGLGIRLTDTAGTVVSPGYWTAVTGVDTTVKPDRSEVLLQAMLVSETTSDLTADTFSASASVVMTYV